MSRWVTPFAHSAMRWALKGGHGRFQRQSRELESVQRKKLARLVERVSSSTSGARHGVSAALGWEDYARELPVTDYAYWKEDIEAQRDGRGSLINDPVMRYQPTSGSTSKYKLIPYTQSFLNELDSAIAPWIYQLYKDYPGIAGGRHYWSLSWLPDGRRKELSEGINDDMNLLSPVKRIVAKSSQAVPQSVSMTETVEDSFFATVAHLASADDLSMISIWSPTFGLRLFEVLSDHREEIAEVLTRGDWGDRAAGMGGTPPPVNARAADKLMDWDGQELSNFWSELWPGLALVSSWDTASSAHWAHELRQQLPGVAVEGKGLWATEGVVTIPWGERFPLAYQSHVYEFEDLSTGEVLPPWQLDAGQRVKPILSTGNGLLRYRMNDVVEVEGFMGAVPCLVFKGRDDGVDMVGEKMSVLLAQRTLEAFSRETACHPVSLLAVMDTDSGEKPHYLLLAEGQPNCNLEHCIAVLDRMLAENFHYELARNLGQLESPRCVIGDGARALYTDICLSRGMLEGDIKVEPLKRVDHTIESAFSLAQPQPVSA
ncbi:MAG: GH3 family domain-containing protein [Pseudomonadota bacterium]